MDLLVLSATLFTSSPVKGFCTQKKKEKPCIDTQRNKVSGFPDGSHICKMDF